MISLAAIGLASVILIGCGSGGNENGSGGPGGPELKILKITVGSEPEDVDPHVVTGVPEHHIIASLTEGLVAEDPVDLHPVPGVAEKWDISEDGKVYTFHFRENAKWSNGDAVTANDFVMSYKRILTPALASKYAYMLFVMEGNKTAQEVESFDAGYLRLPPDAPNPGDAIVVGQRLAFLADEDDLEPWKDAPRAEAGPGHQIPTDKSPGPAASQGVRAGPGTLRHPNSDKIFTKWVAIKDLDAA